MNNREGAAIIAFAGFVIGGANMLDGRPTGGAIFGGAVIGLALVMATE